MRNLSLIAVSIVALWSWQESVARCQSEPEANDEISIRVVGALECVDDGEHRLGANDRMFLIEDQWQTIRIDYVEGDPRTNALFLFLTPF